MGSFDVKTGYYMISHFGLVVLTMYKYPALRAAELPTLLVFLEVSHSTVWGTNLSGWEDLRKLGDYGLMLTKKGHCLTEEVSINGPGQQVT